MPTTQINTNNNNRGLPPTRYWFVLFQHGLQGTVKNFSILKTVLASAIQEHNTMVLEQWKTNTSSTTTAASAESLPLIEMTPFDTSVNSWFKSLAGTVSTGQKLYVELRKGLIVWAGEVATRVAVQHRTFLAAQEECNKEQEASTSPSSTVVGTNPDTSAINNTTLVQEVYFSAVGHSFGGIILREVIAMIVEDTELQTLFEETGFVCDFFDGKGSVSRDDVTVSPITSPRSSLPKRITVKINLQFSTYSSIVTPHCGVQRLSGVGKGFSSIMSMFGSFTHHELLMHDVKQEDVLALVREALEENPSKKRKDLVTANTCSGTATTDEADTPPTNDDGIVNKRRTSVFSTPGPLPPSTLPDAAPVLTRRLLQPHYLDAWARFKSRTVYAAVNGDPFVTFQTGSFLFEGFIQYLKNVEYNHLGDTITSPTTATSGENNNGTTACDLHHNQPCYFGGKNQCRHRQGFIVRQTLDEAERDAKNFGKDSGIVEGVTTTASSSSSIAVTIIKDHRRQRFQSSAEELRRLEEGYNISMRLKPEKTTTTGTDGNDDTVDNSSLEDIAAAISDDDLDAETKQTNAAKKLKVVEKIEETLNMFNSSVRRPIHPSLYPSVLPGITIGGDAISKAYLKHASFQYASNAASISTPNSNHQHLSHVEVEDMVAATVLAAIEVDVIPIRSDLFLHATHKAVLGASKFGRPIGDAIEFIAKSLVADVAHY